MRQNSTYCRGLAWLALVLPLWVVAPEAGAQGTGSRAQPALRLVIEYVEGEFSILSQNAVRKVLPPSDELPAVQSPNGQVVLPSGFWIEVVLGDGSVRYRRIMENPIYLTFEGINPEDQGLEPKLERVESLPQRKVFSILIPAYPPDPVHGPPSLRLFSSPLRVGARAESASEIGRLILDGGQTGPVIAQIQED
jgi:hypothetical protein